MPLTFRPGTFHDSFAAYRVHHHAIAELLQRLGVSSTKDEPSEEEILHEWETSRSLYDHLARTAERFWVAEQDGEIVGYSRSCRHDDVCQLSEFFVLPGLQAKGIGKELLARAFPRQNARLRMVIATPEIRAQTLYMRSGLYTRHALYSFSRELQRGPTSNLTSDLTSDLIMEPMALSPDALALLGAVDGTILGFKRDDDHAWLMSQRQGWLYRRQGDVVGYGYIGAQSGPFALLEPTDFPAVLAHAEQQAMAADYSRFALWVHSTNRCAIDYLLAHQYRMFPFIVTLLSDAPFGELDHYINTAPPFIL